MRASARVIQQLRRAPPAPRGVGRAPALDEEMRYGRLVRKNCSQLFFVFAGTGGQLMLDPSTFLRASRLLERNVVLIRDGAVNRYGYTRAISSFPKFIEWQRSLLVDMSHVSEVHCLGSSLGGYTAIISGHALAADAVWAFAPPTALSVRDVSVEYQDLRLLLSNGNGKTRYHLIYNESCATDRVAALRIADCPGVELHPQRGEGHLVVGHLFRAGALANVLPDFAPTTRERVRTVGVMGKQS